MAKIDKEITELIGKNKVTPNRGLWGVVRRDSGRRSRVSRASYFPSTIRLWRVKYRSQNFFVFRSAERF